MRVLFLTPDVFRHSGGIARYCRLACKALSDSEEVKRVDIVSLHDPCGQPPDARYLSAARGDYFPAGGDVWKFIRQIVRLTITRKYDLYLVGHVNFATLLWACRLLSPGTAVIPFAYGIEVWSQRHWARRIGISWADQLIAISRFTRDKMIEANDVLPAKIRVLYNCFDPYLGRRVAGNGAAGLKLEHPNLLTVSRISKEDHHKGHAVILRALTQVRRDVPGVHYYVVGAGDLVPDLQQMVAEFKLEPNVHFLGFVSDDELSSVYEQCDLFVMPGRWEGFGYVFAEAMAYGKAVIAGNQDATVEVVRDHETGLLVDPCNHEELAKALTLLLTDREMRERMGRRGAQVVDEEFGFEKFRRTLIGYLGEAVEQKRGTSPFARFASHGQQ